MRILILLFGFQFLLVSCSQSLTSKELLERSINYHDPHQRWTTFNDTFKVIMDTPNQANRVSTISINLPENHFRVRAIRDTIDIVYEVMNDSCFVSLNGKTEFSEEEKKANRLDCDRANLYKNYYTYLYGLPMKLKDPGTQLAEHIEQKTFKGKEYLVLKVTYNENVGSDIWYFYFDPETYAMEIYQFFKTDEQGNMLKDSGEYILLSKEKEINGIKMPKIRDWYYNKDDAYLGSDVLE